MLAMPAAFAAFAVLAIPASSPNARAAGDPRAPLELVVSARVVDDTGWPIERARVSVEGGRGANALTGTDGRCAFRVALGAPRDLPAHPIVLAVRAQAHGTRLAFSDGSDALRLEISVTGPASGGATVRVRSNSAGLAAAVAAAWPNGGSGGIPCEASFIALAAAAPAPRSAALSAVLEVNVTGIEAPASSATPSVGSTAPPRSSVPAHPQDTAPRPATSPRRPAAPPGDTASATRSPGSHTERPTIVGSSVSTTRTMPHAISTPPDGVPVLTPSKSLGARDADQPCVCRVTGTVEVDWDHPLPHPLRVTVSLFDLPAVRDTVRLDMGSPRAFTLRDVPCGSHRLQVMIPRHAHFDLATPADNLLFGCERAGVRPVRIVLVRR